MDKEGLHIGTITKPYGYDGWMVLKGDPGKIDRLIKGIPLFIEISGQRVPFFIEDLETDAPAQKALVKCEFIESEADVRKVSACNVYAELSPELNDARDPDLPDLVGFGVIDRLSGKKGQVRDFMDLPGNPLLVIDMEGQEVLLPALADYLEEISIEDQLITAAFPEGLIGEEDIFE